MLSDDVEADASPKLIIHNHDTGASRSATVGQVDEEDLFYMTSRGLPFLTARNMLVEHSYSVNTLSNIGSRPRSPARR